jgi:hypothetical protein
MGYVTEAVVWPTEAQVRSHIQSHYTVLFYELAHGGSTSFSNACDDSTRASEIETWIADYHKMPFAFIGSCGGMCSTDDGTLSYEFRKGSNEFTATVGYCGMSDSPCVDDCWYAGHTISWQSALFGYINEGRSVKAAFDLANADYPGCGANECMRFAGDDRFTLVPVVDREARKIQRAIDAAADGDTVVVAEGIYDENISFKGKKITVRSTDPNNEAVVTATLIRGSGDEPVVTFSESEDVNCILAGFFITDGNTGIYCSGASPTIVSCIITANSGDGLRSCNGSNPRITNCLIAANEGDGVGLGGIALGSAKINNCTIVTNQQHGVYQGIPTVTNSIIYFNRLGIDSPLCTITYSNVEGSWPGEGNIYEDPGFGNAFHLKSQAGRWIPSIGGWFLDGVTSPCVDAGNPGCPLGDEAEDGNNVRINMGAYGGTAKASRTPGDWRSLADFNNDWIVDFNDVTAFVGYWLDEGECVPGDLNRNKSVDFADFGIFGENWRWKR